jgi:hypothetical protein
MHYGIKLIGRKGRQFGSHMVIRDIEKYFLIIKIKYCSAIKSKIRLSISGYDDTISTRRRAIGNSETKHVRSLTVHVKDSILTVI